MTPRFNGVLRRVTLAVVLALVGPACTGGADEKAGSPGPTTTVPEEQPVRGGTLVVALDGDPGSLNPAVTTDEGVHAASEPMFNGLVGLGPRGEIVPELAERWTIEENGAIYRFALRRGVKWHDRQPFSSEDVKFTFEKALLPFHSRARTTLAAVGVKIEAPDPLTVVFSFSAPYAPLLRQLDVTEAPIIPRHVYERCSDISGVPTCPANRTPVGTGPFKIESYDANEVRMVRNADYFRSGLPYFDAMVERFAPDQEAKTLAFRSSEVDWIWTFRSSEVANIGRSDGIQRSESPRGPGGGHCMISLAFNLKPAPGRTPFLIDPRVRQALWAATDRQEALVRSPGDHGVVAPYPIHSAIRAARAIGLNLPVFDVGRAKRLLDLAGWKDEGGSTRVARAIPGIADGTPFDIDYHGLVGQEIAYGQALKAQWRAVGVNLETKQEDSATKSVNVQRDRQFDTAATSSCQEADPYIGARGQFHSSQLSSAPVTNVAGYSNTVMDHLWDESTSQIDPPLRQQLFQQIQELAVRDLPYLWLAEISKTRLWDPACIGFNQHHTGLFAEAAFCKR